MKTLIQKIKSLLLIVLVMMISNILHAQNPTSPRLFIGGGALPDAMYDEFFEFCGPDVHLVVIPTATGLEIDETAIKEDWRTSGFTNVSVLHTRDREVSSDPKFSEVLKTATAVWFSGGSQDRIAAAYLGTPVEEEIYKFWRRGGVIGGSSAGAAIMSRVMIIGGNPEPEIATGFDLLPGVILDQHFLKRNRLPRLIAAVKANPGLVGLGIDEATAIVVENNELKVTGESYVMRIEWVDGELKVDAYEAGEVIPLRY